MTNNSNNVYCYYEDIGFSHQDALIGLWAASWSARGWNPIILGRSDAEKSPHYGAVLNAAEKLPTVNNRSYSLANYLRYCALQSVGGGLLTDYDVINYELKPSHLADIIKNRPFARLHVGGFVYLSPVASVWFCEAITIMRNHVSLLMNYDGQPHVSDVDVQEVFVGDPRYNLCAIFGEYNWDKFPVVHYSNDSMPGISDKAFAITCLRELNL